MSKFNQPDSKAMNALMNAAAKSLGTTPEQLKEQIDSGSLQRTLSGMNNARAAQLSAALSDPKSAERIMNTPQAKALIKKLMK